MAQGLTYGQTGVDYDAMDPFKKACQLAGMATATQLERHGCKEVPWSRGESCSLIETTLGHYLAHVEEGLGTKNVVADSMAIVSAVNGMPANSFYRGIGQDNLAMVVNDLITSGASPISFMLHLAVGSGDWFKNEKRVADLIAGTAEACAMARCFWGGGETPTLKGIVLQDQALLSGSATGFVSQKDLINPANIQHGDVIVFFKSSGPHANGYTMLRALATDLPGGYMTRIYNDMTYGEAILAPTHIYAALLQECQKQGVKIHYAINMTGHGWRKLMRAKQPFAYVIDRLPNDPNEIFRLIKWAGKIDDKEMFATFNMGAGFAIIIPEKDWGKVVSAHATLRRGEDFARNNFGILLAGQVVRSQEKKVIINPVNVQFYERDLDIR